MKIRTKAYQEGFRRAGVAHPKEWKEWPADRFNGDQIQLLRNEPMVMVEIITEESDATVATQAVAMLADLPPDDQRVAAALQAMAQGNVIGSGKPSVEAMEATLGRSVSAEERDEAWAIAKAVKAEDDAKAEA